MGFCKSIEKCKTFVGTIYLYTEIKWVNRNMLTNG